MHPLFARLTADFDDARHEYQNIENAIRMFDALGPEIANSWARWRAVAAGIDSVYSGLEKILRSIASEIDGYSPTDNQWHVSLLKQLALPIEGIRSAVLSPETFALLNEIRAFRHVVRNLYGFKLDTHRIEENWKRLQELIPAFEDDLRKFMTSMFPPPD